MFNLSMDSFCLSGLYISGRKKIKIVLAVSLVLLMSACGTTSGIKQQGDVVNEVDLTKYNVVVIKAFDDETKGNRLPIYASNNFSDRITGAIRGKGTFEQVLREADFDPKEHEASNVMMLQGAITRYQEGNAALKLWVGFGAGSTYFDAKVELFDMLKGDSLGQIDVDRNSWALGGAIAASQTVDQFMREAAEKVASELAKKRVQ